LGAAGGSGIVVTNVGTNSALTITSATASSVSGVIAGVISLTKSGAGAMTVSGINTYSGGTTVSAGSLVAGRAGNAFGATTAAMTVNGGTLDLGSYSQTLGAVSIGTAGGSITGTNCNSRGAAGGREFGREITNANAQTGSVAG
jgi:autotransporter-associated beta strand protein